VGCPHPPLKLRLGRLESVFATSQPLDRLL
jgi:hypothetical protein